MSTTPSKLYRFAVYGLTQSGKTCLLTALTMPRVANPSGFSCSWLPNPPSSSREQAQAYLNGREAIDVCRTALKEGEQPSPTKIASTFPRFRFNFGTTSPQPRTFCVELIDYAGELIDPNVGVGELAARLRRRLSKSDGILVLAESPLVGPTADKLHGDFVLLKAAFAMLRNERAGEPALRVPVALLLNKWDRHHPANGMPHDRESELKDFLESQPPPPHIDLINSLRGAVADDCFRPFVVSAFGAARRDDEGRELPPLTTPLPSFGLEAPFIWAARQRDTLDLDDLKQEGETLTGARRPLPYLNPVFWPAWRLWRRARRLAHRFPAKGDGSIRTRRIRRCARFLALGRTMSFLIFGLLILQGVEATFDGKQRHAVEDNLSQPDRSSENLYKDQQWLQKYAEAPWYRHLTYRLFVFSRSDAQQRLGESRDRREKGLWAAVEAASNEQSREQPAQNYLDTFPNGKHAEEVSRILQRVTDSRKVRENQDHFNAVRRAFDVQKSQGFRDADQLRQLNEKLDRVPNPGNESQEQHNARKKLSAAIGNARITVGQRDVRNQYGEFMREGRVREAGILLASHPMPPKDLMKEFPTKALERVQQDYDRYVKDKRWRDAESILIALTADARVVKLLQAEHVKQLNKWSNDLRLSEDRYLYKQLRLYKDSNRAQQYLDVAPLKRMEKEVKAYRDYLQSLREKLTLKLRLRQIEWGNAWDRDTNYKVTLQGRTIMEGKVHASKNTVSKDVASAEIIYRLNDNITLGVNLIQIGYVKDTDCGSPSWEGAVRNLDGRSLTLEGLSPSSKVYFSLEDVPREPPLPSYREK